MISCGTTSSCIRPAACVSGPPQLVARRGLAARLPSRRNNGARHLLCVRARVSLSSLSGSIDGDAPTADEAAAAAAVEHLVLSAATLQQCSPTASAWLTESPVEVLPAAASGHAGADGAAGSFFSGLLDKIPLSPRTRGIVMLNVLVLLVASNWVVVKDVGLTFDPFGFAFLRFGVAAAALSPFLKAASKDKRIMQAGMELGLWTAAGYIAQSAGLLTTDASRASFLSTFTVLVVPFLAGISGKGVSAVTWASCIAAILGVGLLEQSGASPGIGDVWSMVSAVAFGIQVFRTEHWARILGNNSNLSLMSVVLTTTMLFSAVAVGAAHPDALVNLLHHPSTGISMLTADNIPWHQVLYCGLLTTDLTLLMEVFALQDVSSVDAAIIYTLEPVLGAGFAWALLGERLGLKGMAGAGIILASSVFSQLMSSPKPEGEAGKEGGEGEGSKLLKEGKSD